MLGYKLKKRIFLPLIKIILLTLALLFLTACEDNKIDQAVTISEEAKNLELAINEDEMEIVLEEELLNQTLQETFESAETNSQAKALEATESTQEAVAKQLEKTTKELSKKLEEATAAKQDELTKAASKIASNSKDLPTKATSCAICHGYEGEKEALGKSKIIKNMSKIEIKKALIGYKDGTYGGVLKNSMISQVANLSNEEIEELATYFGKD